ncbi:MFS transporter [Burkholderia multivorans]|uniref:MFS transporter n=1 Tax=Burkholderia multivorans TaxID=87883 RepID=UPI0011B25D32|nr:MFS transporter [Burkholderia multivorans]
MDMLDAQAGMAQSPRGSALAALTTAQLGLFVITLDTVAVNVDLPGTGHELYAGITGLQWVVDGHILAFAALPLSPGTFANRKRWFFRCLSWSIEESQTCVRTALIR